MTRASVSLRRRAILLIAVSVVASSMVPAEAEVAQEPAPTDATDATETAPLAETCDEALAAARAHGGPTQVGCLRQSSEAEMASRGLTRAASAPADCEFAIWTEVDRQSECQSFLWALSVVDQNGALIGHMFFDEISWVRVANSAPHVEHKVTFQWVAAWGPVQQGTMEGSFSCVTECIEGFSIFNSQLLSAASSVNARGTFDTAVDQRWEVVNTVTRLRFWFSNPPSTEGRIQPDPPRCDQALPGTTNIGCVFKDFWPTQSYSRSGEVAQVAQHIRDAQASGLPGSPSSLLPLHRLTDHTLIDLNRNTACRSGYPRPEGHSCDEYPFAATHEGAATGGAGSARTFDWCQIAGVPTGVTGHDGWSVCMVDEAQNSLEGSRRNSFFNINRVIEGDAFYVRTSV